MIIIVVVCDEHNNLSTLGKWRARSLKFTKSGLKNYASPLNQKTLETLNPWNGVLAVPSSLKLALPFMALNKNSSSDL